MKPLSGAGGRRGSRRGGTRALQRGLAIATLTATLAACDGSPPPIERFTGGAPQFDPVRFFTGHVRSWGVIEDRSGGPTGRVTTDCRGDAEGEDGLRMVQRLAMDDGSTQTREWHMRRTGPHSYEATANDMVGVAHGEARGRAFHWEWVLATSPGNPLRNVVMEQWMYLMDDGAMVNRTIVRKLGLTLIEVTEQFAPVTD